MGRTKTAAGTATQSTQAGDGTSGQARPEGEGDLLALRETRTLVPQRNGLRAPLEEGRTRTLPERQLVRLVTEEPQRGAEG
jgi:hypothetical protein